MNQITLIKTGGTIPEINHQYGDFENWFREGLEGSAVQQVDVYKQQALPEPAELTAIVITGSAAMVSHREDWSEKTADWLRLAVGMGIPVLGVCYGHQLLAHALGGKVGPNPNGRQIGTVRTNSLAAASSDPLLQHLPLEYPSQASHSEAVLALPPNAERLASSPLDDNFAIRFDQNAWGVQYHPEFSAVVMSRYIELRSAALREEGLDPDALSGKVTETPQAGSVLKQFAALILPKNH